MCELRAPQSNTLTTRCYFLCPFPIDTRIHSLSQTYPSFPPPLYIQINSPLSTTPHYHSLLGLHVDSPMQHNPMSCLLRSPIHFNESDSQVSMYSIAD